MYLAEAWIQNSGPIENLKITPQYSSEGLPKPVVLVGTNGSGKTGVLSIVADALFELAVQNFSDITTQTGSHRAFFRMLGGRNQRAGAKFELSLLRLKHGESDFYYRAKAGTLPVAELAGKIDAYGPVSNWTDEGADKVIAGPTEKLTEIYEKGAYAFFPSTRFEVPHWVNSNLIERDPGAVFGTAITGVLDKPLFVESGIQSLKPWIVDLILDQSVDLSEMLALALKTPTQLPGNLANRLTISKTFSGLNHIIATILGVPTARLVRRNRSFGGARIGIVSGTVNLAPTLDHLSSGQSTLLTIFGTLLRYADKNNIRQGLGDIEGLVLVDEIDAHLHADLQHDVLPKLIKLFPRVQFIVSSHSPLFPLGMRDNFGDDGYSLIELPSGLTIDAERFSEFGTSMSYFSATRAFETSLQETLSRTNRPLILCEGETDPKYLKAAAELLGFTDLAEQVDFDWVGQTNAMGADSGGKNSLFSAQRFLKNNPQFINRKVALVYDSDAQMNSEDIGRLHIRTLPKNPANTLHTRGIENLLNPHVFQGRFYAETKSMNADVQVTKRFLKKTELCTFICEENRDPADFDNFRQPLEELKGILFPPPI